MATLPAISSSVMNLTKSIPEMKKNLSKRVPPRIKEPLQWATGRFTFFCSRWYDKYGETWFEITQIAIRALAPFAALFLSFVIFPSTVAKVIVTPIVFATIFLAAFYGIKEQDSALENAPVVHLDSPEDSSDEESIQLMEEEPLFPEEDSESSEFRLVPEDDLEFE